MVGVLSSEVEVWFRRVAKSAEGLRRPRSPSSMPRCSRTQDCLLSLSQLANRPHSRKRSTEQSPRSSTAAKVDALYSDAPARGPKRAAQLAGRSSSICSQDAWPHARVSEVGDHVEAASLQGSTSV